MTFQENLLRYPGAIALKASELSPNDRVEGYGWREEYGFSTWKPMYFSHIDEVGHPNFRYQMGGPTHSEMARPGHFLVYRAQTLAIPGAGEYSL